MRYAWGVCVLGLIGCSTLQAGIVHDGAPRPDPDTCWEPVPVREVPAEELAVAQRAFDAAPLGSSTRGARLFLVARLHDDLERFCELGARTLDTSIFELQRQGKTAEFESVQRRRVDLEQCEKRWLQATVSEHIKLVNDPAFASDPQHDEYLYSLIGILTRAHRQDLARPIFKRLQLEHPDSPRMPDAFRAFGDELRGKEPAVAARYYDKVLEFPRTPCHRYAHFRIGQSHLGLERWPDALDAFAAALVESDDTEDRTAQAAEEGAVAAYARIGVPKDAAAFLQRLRPARRAHLLERLAGEYRRTGRPTAPAP